MYTNSISPASPPIHSLSHLSYHSLRNVSFECLCIIKYYKDNITLWTFTIIFQTVHIHICTSYAYTHIHSLLCWDGIRWYIIMKMLKYMKIHMYRTLNVIKKLSLSLSLAAKRKSSLAALGLVENNAPNIVAAMLVSPLMGPVMSITFGAIISDRELMVSMENKMTSFM